MFNRFGSLPFTISLCIIFLNVSLLTHQLKGVQRSELFDEAVRKAGNQIASSVVHLRYLALQTDESSSSSSDIITTGFLLDADGWILTSDFGLPSGREASASSLRVVVNYADGSKQVAKVISRDFPHRIAMLKTNEAINITKINHTVNLEQRPGETAIVMGRGLNSNQMNFSVGIVSAIDRLSGRAIQIDANTSASNYGGPLLNLRGELLGIVSPLGPTGQRGEDWYDSGIGFAVPIMSIKQRLATLKAGQSIYAGWAGLQLASGNPYSSKPYIKQTIGPAAIAGIEAGDLVTHLTNVKTPTIARLRRELRRHDAGDELPIILERDGETIQTKIKLTQKPIEPTKTDAAPKIEAKRLIPKEASQPAE